jgi:hypothetical protein
VAALSRRRSAAIRLLGLWVRTDCLSLVSVVCCQVQGSATGRSLVQRSPTECGVSECDLETSRSGPLGLPSNEGKKNYGSTHS